MTQIDEKAFEKITKTHSDVSKALWRNAIIAYESAKAPRTISRDELEVAVNARQGYLMRQRDPLRNIVPIEQEAMEAALASLGITVEGE